MDENKLEYNLNEIKFKLLNHSTITAADVEQLDKVLSFIISNNLELKHASALHSIIFILNYSYAEELPFFTTLLVDLLQKKMVFNDLIKNSSLLTGDQMRPSRAQADDCNNTDNNCCSPNTDTNQHGFKPGERYKMINKRGKTKEIITYLVNEQGIGEEIGRDFYEEPDIDQFFSNILGDEIIKNNVPASEDDL